jgi:hypothetical protein
VNSFGPAFGPRPHTVGFAERPTRSMTDPCQWCSVDVWTGRGPVTRRRLAGHGLGVGSSPRQWGGMAAMKTVAQWCVLGGERWPTVGGCSDVLLRRGQRKREVSDNLI